MPNYLLHPGEVFMTRFLPLKQSLNQFALNSGIDPSRMREFAGGLYDVDVSLAGYLGEATKTSAQFWLDMQSAYDVARRAHHA